MIYSVEIQKNMKRLREALGISQEEAAHRAGMSRVRWQEIESGYENVTVDTLRNIALVFGVSPLVLGIFAWPDSKILSALHKRSIVPTQKSVQIGGNIILARKERKLTQKQLAGKAHVSASRLRDIEHDCANVTMKTLEKIAEAMELSLLELSTLCVSKDEMLEQVHAARRSIEGAAYNGKHAFIYLGSAIPSGADSEL